MSIIRTDAPATLVHVARPRQPRLDPEASYRDRRSGPRSFDEIASAYYDRVGNVSDELIPTTDRRSTR